MENSSDSIHWDRTSSKGGVRRLWISLNASWSSKWWYATVHTITAVVGSGVLSLPSAMAFLGWEMGTLALLGFIILSQVCYWQIITLHEMDGRRFDRYHELGQHVLGPKLGFWLVVPLQMCVELMVDTVYTITGASSLKKVYELILCDDTHCTDIKLYYWMIIFIVVQLLLAQLPSIQSITWISCIAAAMSIGYSTLAWIAVLLQNRKVIPPGLTSEQVKGKWKPNYGHPNNTTAYEIFTYLGKIAFSTAAGQNTAMEIQATIPSTPMQPSKVAMWNGVFVAYLVVTFCYLPVALTGYRLYGNIMPTSCLKDRKLKDCHLLLFLDHPKGMIIASNLMVALHMCGSYQVYAIPLFGVVEASFERRFNTNTTLPVRFILRSAYVGFTLFLAAIFRYKNGVLVLLGFAIFPTTYLIPSLLWHLTRRPRMFSLPWVSNMVSMTVGVVFMITLATSGLHNIIKYRAS